MFIQFNTIVKQKFLRFLNHKQAYRSPARYEHMLIYNDSSLKNKYEYRQWKLSKRKYEKSSSSSYTEKDSSFQCIRFTECHISSRSKFFRSVNEFKTANVRHEKCRQIEKQLICTLWSQYVQWHQKMRKTYKHVFLLHLEKDLWFLQHEHLNSSLISATQQTKITKKNKINWWWLWRSNVISTNRKIQAWWMLIYLFSLFCLERRFMEIGSIVALTTVKSGTLRFVFFDHSALYIFFLTKW